MGTVKLKDFRPAVLARQTEALAKLRDISRGKLHETYWNAYERQLREAGRLLQAIDANPDAAISKDVGCDAPISPEAPNEQ